jgi:cobalamin synthase
MSLTPHRSSLILLAHLPIPGFNTVVLARYLAFQPSAALILATVYQAYYIALEPIGGVSLSPSILPTRARCNSPQL